MATTLMEVYKMDGIKDLKPMRARTSFAKAWLAEQNGDYETAAKLLDEAVEAEKAELAAAQK